MMQFMTPLDYWRTGMALWSRSAELQMEMTRVAFGMAGGWSEAMMGPGMAAMRAMHPTGTRTARTIPASAAPAQEAPAKPTARNGAAAPEVKPAPRPRSAKVTPLKSAPTPETVPAAPEAVAFDGRRGLVFQEARLFPHLTVRGNLRFGLRHAPRALRPTADRFDE
ncbi:MAG: hypothetical protein AAFR44_15205, partial [Pseudomonadota bacterium]